MLTTVDVLMFAPLRADKDQNAVLSSSLRAHAAPPLPNKQAQPRISNNTTTLHRLRVATTPGGQLSSAARATVDSSCLEGAQPEVIRAI